MYRFRPLWLLCCLTVMALLFSCLNNEPGSSTENSWNEFTEPGETEVEFVLQNETDAPLLIQRSTLPAPGWLSVMRDGEAIGIMWDCGMPCPCDDVDRGCDVCDMLPPYVEEIAPGDEIRLHWEGIEYAINNDESQACYETVSLEEQVMEVEFCYGFESYEEYGGENVQDRLCEIVEFHLGYDQEVVLTITEDPEIHPEPPEDEIDFIVQNETEDTIYVQMSDGAISPEPAWLAVFLDTEQIHVQYDCGLPCPCDDTDPCMMCGAPMPWVRAIEPGSEERFTWDGHYLDIISDDGGDRCYEERQLEAVAMSADLCYGIETQELEWGEYVDDPQCESVGFHFGFDEEVVVIVE